MLDPNRAEWKLSKVMRGNKFIDSLQNMKILRAVELSCPRYGHFSIIYLYLGSPLFDLSTCPKLKEQIVLDSRHSPLYARFDRSESDTIYINAEQTSKPPKNSRGRVRHGVGEAHAFIQIRELFHPD